MGRPYKITSNQLVPRSLEEVFAFFSRAENLEEITPEWLSFQVMSVEPEPIRKGTLIEYRLKLHGLPLRWTSQIVEWDPPHKFVDLQLRGPYKLWRHTHLFIAEGGNTRICDEVLYSLPLGPLGDVVERLFVHRDIKPGFLTFEHRLSAPISVSYEFAIELAVETPRGPASYNRSNVSPNEFPLQELSCSPLWPARRRIV